MHYYDCPCDDCRGRDHDALYERLLTVIERLEAELERPRVREYERALGWLAAVCGGPDAVAALGVGPLTGPVPVPDDTRAGEVAALLRTLARDLFDAEVEVALLRGLSRLWDHDPGLVLAPASPTYVAAGLAWAIGEANDVVGADRAVTASRLKHALATPANPSVYARPVRRALGGLWPWQVDPPLAFAPLPRLAVLGDPALLTSRTRRQLVRVRDHALAARAEDRAVA